MAHIDWEFEEMEEFAEWCYRRAYEDGRLPRDKVPPNPDEVYADEWKGWSHAIGLTRDEFRRLKGQTTCRRPS